MGYKRRNEEEFVKFDVISMMLRSDTSIRMDIDDDNTCTDDDVITHPAMVRDRDGRLPLHIGAEIGLKWHNGLNKILDAYSAAVEIPDPLSGLYVFMLAAVGDEYDLNGIFRLFVEQPDIIQ